MDASISEVVIPLKVPIRTSFIKKVGQKTAVALNDASWSPVSISTFEQSESRLWKEHSITTDDVKFNESFTEIEIKENVPVPAEKKVSDEPSDIAIGRDFFFRNKLDNMEEEERKDFCEDITNGMATKRLMRIWNIEEEFILWARKELNPQNKILTEEQRTKIRDMMCTGNLGPNQIAKLLDLDEKKVAEEIRALKNPDTKPLEDAIKMPTRGYDARAELPQYLLRCDSVQIRLDSSKKVQLSHPKNRRLHRLYNGECTCQKENANVLNLIVVGQTGTGKTTLIDTYANYLCGISQYDRFRYRLIDEVGMKQRVMKERKGRKMSSSAGAADSVTSAVTIYHIKSEWIKRPINPNRRACINIIDTPGFGDTRGIAWDRLIYNMIEKTLKNLKMLDYVLLVVKSSDTRLGASTKFVFQNIQNLWAKDISSRILIMYTFSDGKTPLAIQALSDAGIVSRNGFKFNNSAIWQKCQDKMITIFFNLCYQNYQEFNKFMLNQSHLPPISLRLTQSVLDMRKNVERISIEATRQSQCLNSSMTSIKKKMQEVYANAEKINSNKSFTTKIEKIRKVKSIYTGDITQCSICDITEGKGRCHMDCGVGDDKIRCSAINSSTRMCKWCPHPVERHFNTRVYYVPQTYSETIEVSHKKKLYDEAGRELDNVSKVIRSLFDHLIKLTSEFEDCQKQIKNCNDWLSANAMRRQAYYSVDFFKEQIEYLKGKGNTLENERQIENLTQMVRRQDAIRNALQGKVKVDKALSDSTVDADLEVKVNKRMFQDMRAQFEVYKRDIVTMNAISTGVWSTVSGWAKNIKLF